LNRCIKVLQTSPLPLGYGADAGENITYPPHLCKVPPIDESAGKEASASLPGTLFKAKRQTQAWFSAAAFEGGAAFSAFLPLPFLKDRLFHQSIKPLAIKIVE